MKFLTIPHGKGYYGAFWLIIGVIALICSGIFILANILFSALGVMLFSGGKIVWDYSNALYPTFTILQGGKIGLLLGLTGGIIACISQIRLWIAPTKGTVKTISERKGLLYLLSIAFVIYDLLSTYYFINSGTFFDGSNGLLNGLGAMFLALSVAAALFSIGPVIFFVWGLETAIENHKEGLPAFGNGFHIILAFFTNMIKNIDTLANWEIAEDNTAKRGRRPVEIGNETD